MDHVIGFAVRGVSGGLAVASEAIANRKGRKSSASDASPNALTTTRTSESEALANSDDEDFVEQEWALDEAALQSAPDAEYRLDPNQAQAETAEDIARSFIHGHQHAWPGQTGPQPIPLPVLLPQRRPRDRDRGFIRAYAPSLGEYSGIDQDTFIDFLNDFQRATRASPVFDVINIACMGVGMVPSTICLAVSTTVGVANSAAKELQQRYRSNKFLDQVNESLFKPRGLFAMVMTYEPDMPDEAILRADTANPNSVALVKTLDSHDSKLKQKLTRFRLSSGKADERSMPDCAPLIYPSLDLVLQSQPEGTFKNNAAAIAEYKDRRAQANFIHQNRDTKLAQTLPPATKEFASRFADPNHPVNSGSIFGLVSGGHFDPIAAGRVRRAEKKAKKKGEPPLTEEEKHDAYMGRQVRGRVTGTPSKTIPVFGKMLKKSVLYLIIMNLPSPSEIAEMQQALEKA